LIAYFRAGFLTHFDIDRPKQQQKNANHYYGKSKLLPIHIYKLVVGRLLPKRVDKLFNSGAENTL
jgi:hypothetical protein